MLTARRLQGLRPFSQLSQYDLLELSSEAHLRNFGNKQVIYQEQDKQCSVFFILSGSVRLLTSWKNLDPKILSFLGRGEVLGIETAFGGPPFYSHSAISNEELTVLEVPLPIFKERFLRQPQLNHEVQGQLTQRLAELQRDICLAQTVVPYRVAQLLLRFLERQPRSLGGRIQMPLNRLHIAQKTGSQSETVTRILSQWTKTGWITTQDHHIEVLDRGALENIPAHRPGKK